MTGAREAVVARLRAAGCVAPEHEAGLLLAAAPDARTLDRWVTRREHGEPVAWIVGMVRFCGQRLSVTRGVFVPREQSQELARRAARCLPAGGRAIDLCTGVGAVAAHLRAAVPTAAVVGVDVDPVAAACAARNGVPALVGDLAEPVRADGFDLVTAVAPYVPTADLELLPSDVRRYEPSRALDGGPDGTTVTSRVVDAATRLLRPGGRLFVEAGGEQDDLLAPRLEANGFDDLDPWWDDEGDLRGIAARRRT